MDRYSCKCGYSFVDSLGNIKEANAHICTDCKEIITVSYNDKADDFPKVRYVAKPDSKNEKSNETNTDPQKETRQKVIIIA